jgi:hypothetical protein
MGFQSEHIPKVGLVELPSVVLVDLDGRHGICKRLNPLLCSKIECVKDL